MDKDNLPEILEAETVALMQRSVERAIEFAKKSKSDSTWKSYQSDMEHFEAWCKKYQLQHLPAEPKTVVLYLVQLSDTHKIATLKRRIAAISQAHLFNNMENPTSSPVVKMTMQGIRNEYGSKQKVRKVRPAVASVMHKLVAPLGTSLIDIRDRALLLIGFAGAFRRSELAQLQLQDITVAEEGLRILMRKSKTDQAGEGYTKGIVFGHEEGTCPVRAWQAWLHASALTDGMAFRSVTRLRKKARNKKVEVKPVVIGESMTDRTIANIIKRRIAAAGLDANEFSGHSLRAGLVTEAARRGKPERDIMKQSNHKHLPTLREYIREGALFLENVTTDIGL